MQSNLSVAKHHTDVALETVRLTSILLQPAIPESASRVLDQLQVPHSARHGPAALQFGALPAGHSFKAGSLVLFAKSKPAAAPPAALAAPKPAKIKPKV